MLLGYSYLCPGTVLIGHGLGPALKSLGLVSPQLPSPLPLRWLFTSIRDCSSLSLAEHGTLDLATDQLCGLARS